MIVRWTDAASAWLLTYLVHSTLILVGAWLVTKRKSLSETTREVLWKCALVGGLATASVQTAVAHEPLGGQLRLDARTPSATAPPIHVSIRDGLPGERARLFVARSTGARWPAAVVALWLVGAGAALLWLTVAHARASRALADRTSLDDSPIAARMRSLIERSDVRQRIDLTCSATISSPVALASGEVCLPRRALVELDATEQDSMLAHEIAHVVRRDPQWLIAARVIEVVFFFQPLNRLARRRVQEIAEFLCDDWAVQRTSQPVTLAKCLAAVAEWVGRAPRLHPMSAMVESGGSPLVQRVRRILGGDDSRRGHSTRGALVASACALLVLTGAAPRISIAGDVTPERTLTVVQTITRGAGPSSGRDTVVIVGSSMARMEIDSIIRRADGRGVATGPIARRGNIVVRRISTAAPAGDSVAVRTTWTRSLPAPQRPGAPPQRAFILLERH